jgi:nucleoside 2-deoxyribosyltransferase
MKVYVASSWRNQEQPSVVEALRQAGHEVYDFRNPAPGNKGFHWSEIDPDWQKWTSEQYRKALDHPVAEDGFALDMQALVDCDAVVAVQPFGRSASLELGWACGAGKFTVLLLATGEPELMVKMVDCVCLDLDEVVACLTVGKV